MTKRAVGRDKEGMKSWNVLAGGNATSQHHEAGTACHICSLTFAPRPARYGQRPPGRKRRVWLAHCSEKSTDPCHRTGVPNLCCSMRLWPESRSTLNDTERAHILSYSFYRRRKLSTCLRQKPTDAASSVPAPAQQARETVSHQNNHRTKNLGGGRRHKAIISTPTKRAITAPGAACGGGGGGIADDEEEA